MKIYYLFIFLIILTLCSSSELFEEYYSQAEKYLNKMTIEERIGQMFFPRYDPETASDDIKNRKPGGFVLFAKDFNYEEDYIKNYIQELQNISKESNGLPLGLAVDEEGGLVVRVSRYHRKEGKFPSPQDIYKESGIEGILKIDQEKRDLLKKFYLNVNLAPVADVSYNEQDFIYERTLGKFANETAYYIGKDVEGYVKDNFSCCAKHFPGYGNNKDTHTGVAVDERSYDNFLKEDFLPFEAAIANKIPMILFSHNIVLCKDSKYPVSLSKEWHNIIRNELHYSGLILTDDISMGAIKQFTNNVSEAVVAILAGNDILLTSDYYKHLDAAIEAYNKGVIEENIINTACRRIIAWKLRYGLIKDNETPKYIEMIKKLEKSSSYASKSNSLSIIGTLLFEQGYEASFVAGILANIYHEANIGEFESSNYASNPNNKPEYLKFMDKLYNYGTKYSGKIITEVSMKELGILLMKLKREKWQKGKFGLGCVQWTGERTLTLYQLYKQECNYQDKIAFEHAAKAEGRMIINELKGNNKSIYNQWKNNNNINTPLAAYNAGYIICNEYEKPKDKEKKGKERGKTAQNMYNIMTS